MGDVWEQIHSVRDWGKYPCEDLVRFIGRNYFKIPSSDRKNIRVLELGCGQGANLWFLAREGFDVYGIDTSPSAIEKAKKTLANWNISSVKLDLQDILDIKYPARMFDIVIDCATVWCVSYTDHKTVYKNVQRILRPGGKFWSFHVAEGSSGYGTGNLIDYKTYDNISEGILQDQGVVCMLSDSDLRKLLSEAGLMVSNIEQYSRTYDNQQHIFKSWIVEAAKP